MIKTAGYPKIATAMSCKTSFSTESTHTGHSTFPETDVSMQSLMGFTHYRCRGGANAHLGRQDKRKAAKLFIEDISSLLFAVGQ